MTNDRVGVWWKSLPLRWQRGMWAAVLVVVAITGVEVAIGEPRAPLRERLFLDLYCTLRLTPHMHETDKQRLVRELPKKRRRTEVSVPTVGGLVPSAGTMTLQIEWVRMRLT